MSVYKIIEACFLNLNLVISDGDGTVPVGSLEGLPYCITLLGLHVVGAGMNNRSAVNK